MSSDEEYRRNSRVREDIPVVWREESCGRSGAGVIRDISVSGVLLEMDTYSCPEKNSGYVLSAQNPADELVIPDRTRLVWSRPMKFEQGKYMCGMEFVQPSQQVIDRLSSRIEAWFVRVSQTADLTILSNYFKGRNRPS